MTCPSESKYSTRTGQTIEPGTTRHGSDATPDSALSAFPFGIFIPPIQELAELLFDVDLDIGRPLTCALRIERFHAARR
jgi:hypothetical protein